MDLGWKEAVQYDVGGRTRALAIDINDPNTIIAGGVSGGIWKSTDKGATWQMKSTTSQVLSVTSIAQDPRNGQTNNWYYATGEFLGIQHRSWVSTQDFLEVEFINPLIMVKHGIYYQSLQIQIQLNGIHHLILFRKLLLTLHTGSIFAASNAYGIIKIQRWRKFI